MNRRGSLLDRKKQRADGIKLGAAAVALEPHLTCGGEDVDDDGRHMMGALDLDVEGQTFRFVQVEQRSREVAICVDLERYSRWRRWGRRQWRLQHTLIR